MFCENCGREINDSARFCAHCGTRVNQIPEQSNAYSPDDTAEEADIKDKQAAVKNDEASSRSKTTSAASSADLDASNKSHKKRKTGLVVGIVIAAIAILAVIAAIILLGLNFTDSASRAHPVKIAVKAEGYSDADTLIPVNITGNDTEGMEIETTAFVNDEGEGIELTSGTYTLTFPASPLTEDGILYTVPENEYEIDIPEDLPADETYDAAETVVPVFKKSTALEESDASINKAYEYASKLDDQEQKAKRLYDKALEVHEKAKEEKADKEARAKAEKEKKEAQAKAAKKKKEAEKQAAEEEAARKAEELAAKLQNPSSVDAVGIDVTLKGKLIREDYIDTEFDEVASASYLLQFENPITIIANGPGGGSITQKCEYIRVASDAKVIKDGDTVDFSTLNVPELQPYLNQYIEATGKITAIDTSNPKIKVMFSDPSISLIQD